VKRFQVQEKIKSQYDIMERFERTLEREEVALRETIASLLQEVKSPALLELDATPDEVKPTLVKHPKRLHKSCFL
jgi:hypothetical protein